ncbi:MAG: undecaprenyl-diphosphate phosphatase [Clostridia bacterium]|nr:undecaprenyl-diphosphate phosphatase [Clostridia bacterium]
MDVIWEILKAVLQGVVQGITEWLPISSTGHLILVDQFLPFSFSQEFFDLFKVLIQLGSIFAVVVLFFRKLNPFSRMKTPQQRTATWKLWLMVLIAGVPTMAVGLPLDDVVDEHLSDPLVIALTLFVYGVLFLWMESRDRTPRFHEPNDIGWKTALCMGCFQALALIPGTSRSGATILGAVLLGCSRYAAAEFSFFMAIPAMAGASGLKVLKFLMDGLSLSWQEWLVLAVGMIVSFVVSLLVIRFLMDFIKKHDFKPFGWYRIVLSAVLAVLILTGMLSSDIV